MNDDAFFILFIFSSFMKTMISVDTIYLLHDIQSRGEENSHSGVYKKYKHHDFHEVSTRASVLRDDLGLTSFQKDSNTAA